MSIFRLLCTLRSSIKDSRLSSAAGAGVSLEVGHSMVERGLAEALLEIEIVVFLVPVLLSSDEEEDRNFAELSRECPLAHALRHFSGRNLPGTSYQGRKSRRPPHPTSR